VSTTPQPKYKVGETVYGRFGEKKCVVEYVAADYHGVPYTEPLYRIHWPISGGATARESELTAEPRAAKKRRKERRDAESHL
jgi:hypothetical protein